MYIQNIKAGDLTDKGQWVEFPPLDKLKVTTELPLKLYFGFSIVLVVSGFFLEVFELFSGDLEF